MGQEETRPQGEGREEQPGTPHRGPQRQHRDRRACQRPHPEHDLQRIPPEGGETHRSLAQEIRHLLRAEDNPPPPRRRPPRRGPEAPAAALPHVRSRARARWSCLSFPLVPPAAAGQRSHGRIPGSYRDFRIMVRPISLSLNERMYYSDKLRAGAARNSAQRCSRTFRSPTGGQSTIIASACMTPLAARRASCGC